MVPAPALIRPLWLKPTFVVEADLCGWSRPLWSKTTFVVKADSCCSCLLGTACLPDTPAFTGHCIHFHLFRFRIYVRDCVRSGLFCLRCNHAHICLFMSASCHAVVIGTKCFQGGGGDEHNCICMSMSPCFCLLLYKVPHLQSYTWHMHAGIWFPMQLILWIAMCRCHVSHVCHVRCLIQCRNTVSDSADHVICFVVSVVNLYIYLHTYIYIYIYIYINMYTYLLINNILYIYIYLILYI